MGLLENLGMCAFASLVADGHSVQAHHGEKALAREEAAVNSMVDKEFEKKIQSEVNKATPLEAKEIWDRIERFKRDDPHLLYAHWDSSYWRDVGNVRYPITYEDYFKESGKSSMSKSDQELYRMFRGRTVTLLLNTYEKYSTLEATRIAHKSLYGLGGGTAEWTRLLG